MDSKITCPNCKHKFSPDEAFSHEIEAKLRQNLRDEFNKKYLEEKKKLEEKIAGESGKELELLKEQFEKQKKELDKARDYELELRKRANELEEKEKNLELEKQRQIDEERVKIQESAEKRLKEEYQLTIAEKDKRLSDALKANDELKQKLTQGSQQLQGEVLELELEEVLKREFPIDEILEVGKGKRGADIIHKVKDPLGKVAGIIIWESKRTKSWDKEWVEKLKEDMREIKGDTAILITQVMPDGIKNFGYLDGILIASFDSFIQVASLVRKGIIEISATKNLNVGKNEKIESLYRYITSSEFAQKIESMVDIYIDMRKNLEKEKMYKLREWAEREKHIDRLSQNTLSIHGSFAGLIDEPLSEIKSLNFSEIEILIEEKS